VDTAKVFFRNKHYSARHYSVHSRSFHNGDDKFI